MRKHVKYITISTDASFNHQEGIGAYAFYIICDVFKIKKSGLFKNTPNNSTDAELMCIANSLHTLLVHPDLPTAELIIINSDAMTSFGKINIRSKHLIGKKVATIMRDIQKLTTAKAQLRHVKAHSGKKDARSKANEWCDREAKKWIRKHK